jgi:hypothetical protein
LTGRARAALSLVALLWACGAHAADPAAGEGLAEREMMRRLAAVQHDAGGIPVPFQTDGCSGGLSIAWATLAGRFPRFAASYGDHPPWQGCCIEHDRAYWRGETVDGYTVRKSADGALRRCVQTTGRERAEAIAAALEVTPQDAVRLVDVAGNLMYAAVRIGGAPCTVFPWRWGYGFAHCPIE